MIRAFTLAASAAALLTLTSSASAQSSAADRPQLSATWPVLDQARGGDCTLSITSNGRFMQVLASGLIPGEAVRFGLTNGDMRPVLLTVYANGAGRFQRYYIPFRFNRDGGTVAATLGGARCSLTAAAPWSHGSITAR